MGRIVMRRTWSGRIGIALAALAAGVFALSSRAHAQLMGEFVDVSQEFQKFEPTYYVGAEVNDFDPATGDGKLTWERYKRQANFSFNKIDVVLTRAASNEFPGTEYDRDPALPFSLTFVSPRTVRLRCSARNVPLVDDSKDGAQSLMLAGPVPSDKSWKVEESEGNVTYTSQFGQVKLIKKPWRVEFYDAAGKLLTRTRQVGEPASYSDRIPFSFVRRASDMGRSTAACFELAYNEKIFGCGESFTRLDKRGQKVMLYLRDGMGVQSQKMYKPIPFFLRAAATACSCTPARRSRSISGSAFDQSNEIFTGDDVLDLFVFLGEPKEVLSEYTALTGRSPVPPLWSFGLWMSRITYKSEDEVRDVAAKLREHKIPCDVIHLDTGWFETDWQCDYKFSPSRFTDPEKMMADLLKMGFHICLWQLPYFATKNELFDTIVKNGYEVKNEGGNLAVRGRDARFLESRDRGVVSGQARGLAEARRRRDQSRFRRGCAAARHLCFGPHRLVRAQSLSAALQQSRRRHHEGSHRREHHLGAQRLGRQPALSAALGRRRGEHRFRDGGRAARRPVLWPVGLHLLEPRRGRLRREGAARSLSPLVGVRRADVAHALPRRAAARAVGLRRRIRRRLPPRDRAEISVDAVHLCASQGLAPPTATRCCGRCSSSSRTIRPAGSSTTSTCSEPICWSHRCSRKPTIARCICRRALGSTIRPVSSMKAASGKTSRPAKSRSCCL